MTARRLARAAAIVALFGVLSRLLGFAREIILAAAFGTSAATDAFVNSLLIVNSVAAILLYTLVTLVIPAFSAERAEHGTASAWRLMSALSAWVGALLIALTSVALIWPEAIAAIYFLEPEREAETARLIRIMAPALLLQGLSALLTALLQIHGRFAGPAAVGVAFNAGIIAGVAAGMVHDRDRRGRVGGHRRRDAPDPAAAARSCAGWRARRGAGRRCSTRGWAGSRCSPSRCS